MKFLARPLVLKRSLSEGDPIMETLVDVKKIVNILNSTFKAVTNSGVLKQCRPTHFFVFGQGECASHVATINVLPFLWGKMILQHLSILDCRDSFWLVIFQVVSDSLSEFWPVGARGNGGVKT